MRLLDRYLLRELLVPLAYCLGGFLIFWIAFDLFNELSRFQSQKLKGLDVLEYYAVKTPELLLTVLPVALLLALLYALTNHARHNELTAMRAAGVSLWRLGAPYLAVGLVFSAGLFLFNEWLVPAGNARAEEILERRTANRAGADERRWVRQFNFSNDRDGRVWNVGAYHPDTGEMRDVRVEWFLPNGARRELYAQTGARTNGAWVFRQTTLLSYDPPDLTLPRRQPFAEMTMAEFTETPELLRSELKISGTTRAKAAKRVRFTLAEIFSYLRLHPGLTGETHALIYTQLHARLAAPWTCLVVVFIALPFGALTGRRNVFVGVASSIFICFAFFLLQQLGLNFGTGGHLPPWLAAWLPNALFAAGGIAFTLRVR
ncbi:MAG: LptF/LptG family permease [Verrucomicrobia bacterium]|nr:LptF/LptG family permease [Verrucomicrobiota bacterium]